MNLLYKFFILIKKVRNNFCLKIKLLKKAEKYSEILDEDKIYENIDKYYKDINIVDNIVNTSITKDLSIIIPVYNSEKYINKCIDSIIYQDIKCNYEIICVNDGSTDNSLNILKSYNKIKIISQENKGLSGARNTGINNATGRYILFVDSDDFLPDNSINKMYEKAISTNADIVTGVVGKYIEKNNLIVFDMDKSVETNDYLRKCNIVAGTAWGKLYKRELWDGISFFEGYAFEDTIIFLNIFRKAKKMVYLKDLVYIFRSSSNSLYKRQKKNYDSLDSMFGVFEAVKLNNQNEIINDEHYFQVVLWHLSGVMYSRIANLESDEINKECFNKVRKFIMNRFNKELDYQFYGKGKKLYSYLRDALLNNDYGKYKYYSGLMKYLTEI